MDEIKKIKEIKNTVKIVNIGIIAFLGSIAFFSFIISPSKSAIQTSIGLIIFAIILQIINMTMYMTIKLYYKISYSKIDINLLNQEYEKKLKECHLQQWHHICTIEILRFLEIIQQLF